MDTLLKKGVWQQFGAAIDTLDDALALCPDHLWEVVMWEDPDDSRYGQFWYIAYHTLSWTDLFLTSTYKDFQPPAPFLRGKFPEQPYTRAQIKTYLEHCRGLAHAIIENLTDEKAYEVRKFEWMEPTYLELLFYSMRHLQEHAAQMNLVLGQHGVTGQDWVAAAREKTA